MYLTRHREFPGVSGDDREPCYHDDCVPTDSRGFGLPDSEGHIRVWMPDKMAGFTGDCRFCGKPLTKTTAADRNYLERLLNPR